MMEAGEEIGEFEVVRPLATGGMAAVYLVARSGPGGFRSYAAMKLVRSDLSRHPEFRTMFLDEARLAARIRHPHVIHIEELGEDDGMLYLVMEYIPGVALSSFLRSLHASGRALTPEMAVALSVRFAAGLHAAHETRDDDRKLLHVVHRDVSPQNVLLGVRGEVKIIDFGIASARDRLHETGHDMIRGKLRYMAPEQMQGGDVDRRADIFSLGVVMWEMLTMRRLFQGRGDADVINAITKGELPPPSSYVEVPEAVDALIVRMLSAHPDQRPATGREIRATLKKALPAAFLIEDLDIASLLWGVMGADLAQLPESKTTQPLNTAEMSTIPAEALMRFTRTLSEPRLQRIAQVGVPWSMVDDTHKVSGTSADVLGAIVSSEPPRPDRAPATLKDIELPPTSAASSPAPSPPAPSPPAPSSPTARGPSWGWVALMFAVIGGAIGYGAVHWWAAPAEAEAEAEAGAESEAEAEAEAEAGIPVRRVAPMRGMMRRSRPAEAFELQEDW